LKHITRTVWILSVVSLLTDMASEMLYPIMPVYLKSIGFSIVYIGVIEGIAEAIAGLSKGYFGKLSDSSGRRTPFIQVGYILSAVSKPMMVVWTFPLWILTARTIDRFGKGIRTGARDAMLSDESTPENKGRVFGFHRSMDTTGAVIGPLIAGSYLWFYPQNYSVLFLVAFIPGILAVFASLYLKDKNQRKTAEDKSAPKTSTSFFALLSYWGASSTEYKRLVIGLLVFTLANSSDVFLLLKAKQAGLDDTWVIGIYIFYNLIYALLAFPVGILADKLGKKTIFIIGLSLFALVYFGMAVNNSPYFFFVLFFIYGVYASATEGISKAWISTIADKKDTASAIGTFSGLQSICTMIASSIAGVIWSQFGAEITFITTAIVTLVVIAYFITIPDPMRRVS
jgi:MFS family permease